MAQRIRCVDAVRIVLEQIAGSRFRQPVDAVNFCTRPCRKNPAAQVGAYRFAAGQDGEF